MTDFNQSNWANPEFSRDYRENADIFIVERRRMLAVLQSFYLHFIKDNNKTSMLDIGCGDGIVTSVIVETDSKISATLTDGSEDMLDKARERLKGITDAKYICASFQEMMIEDIIGHTFDFAVSSMAIHHLTMEEKTDFFKKVYSYLSTDGYFVNIDVILAPSDTLEQWYLKLWQEWMDQKKRDLGIKGDQFSDIVMRYKQNKDNKPDRLEDQLRMLKDSGFKDVDCYYKYGIFAMYGGRK